MADSFGRILAQEASLLGRRRLAMRTILISTSTFAKHDNSPLAILKSNGLNVVLNPFGRTLRPSEVVELGKDCIGILAGTEPLTEDVFSNLPQLRAISRCGVGVDNIDLAAAKKRGIIVKTTPDAPAPAVAELTVGLMINLLRHVNASDTQLREMRWAPSMGHLIRDSVVGIIGLGRIGKMVATLLKPFG